MTLGSPDFGDTVYIAACVCYQWATFDISLGVSHCA